MNTLIYIIKINMQDLLFFLNLLEERGIHPIALDVENACKHGKTTLLKTLIHHNVPLTEKAKTYILNGNGELLNVVLSYDKQAFSTQDANYACKSGNLNTLKSLCELGIMCDNDGLTQAAMNGHADTVRFIYNIINLKCSKETIINVIKLGYLECLKAMDVEQFKEFTDLKQIAYNSKQYNIYKWLPGEDMIDDSIDVKGAVFNDSLFKMEEAFTDCF